MSDIRHDAVKQYVVVGPRRTGTTSFGLQVGMSNKDKNVVSPRTFLSAIPFNRVLKKYNLVICPDILHDSCSIKFILQNSVLFDNTVFVRLSRDNKSWKESLIKLEERVRPVTNKFVVEQENLVENNWSVLKAHYETFEFCYVNSSTDDLKALFPSVHFLPDKQHANRSSSLNSTLNLPPFIFRFYAFLRSVF
jgi:hypothetical protein